MTLLTREIMRRVPRILVLLAAASLTLSGAVAGQLGAEIRGPVGPSPYEVVRGWHKPFAQTGLLKNGLTKYKLDQLVSMFFLRRDGGRGVTACIPLIVMAES